MPAITISSLTKRYGDIIALKDINLQLNEPGCIGILGPNGAGKTTMMKLITNVVKPTKGKVEINGINVSDDPRKALLKVGTLVEQPEFYPYISGLETLKFVCRVKGRTSRECEEEIRRVVEITEISPYLKRKVGGYSRGMKQRLSLAAALLCDPEILILDEPTFGLDPKGMKDIRDLIKKINSSGDRIIMLSTHLIYEAKELCDRILIIDRGEIAYDSRVEKNDKWLLVKLDRVPDSLNISIPEVTEYRLEKNLLYLRKSEGTANHTILEALFGMGLKIDSAENYDDLENTYVTIVNK